MEKKRIAIIFGVSLTEYEVSLQSAFAVFENINTNKYERFQKDCLIYGGERGHRI